MVVYYQIIFENLLWKNFDHKKFPKKGILNKATTSKYPIISNIATLFDDYRMFTYACRGQDV